MRPDIYQQARQKYTPNKIKVILITEAPPPFDRHRYFYFEQVRRGDSFFLELMKVLFPEEVNAFETVKQLRAEKAYFLERLQEEGYLLLHAHDEPLPGTTAASRAQTYRENLPQLMATLLKLGSPRTPIVLVSAVVYRAIAADLRGSGFNLIHDQLIEYPNSGQQLNFRRKLKPLLRREQLLPNEV
ncbi:MAG: hypothetical protein WA960_04010 [Tunicatimonas sp.]